MLKLTFFKTLALLGLLVTVFSFVHHSQSNSFFSETNNIVNDIATLSTKKKISSTSPLALMSSAVRLQVTIEYTKLLNENNDEGESVTEKWAGSGVVYNKTKREDGPIRSRILSANHVLETPVVGEIVDDTVEFLGTEIKLGKKRVDNVKIELETADGRTCNVKVLALGSNDQHDVATAEADCDVGRVARLSTTTPIMGEKIYIAGYSLGIHLPMLTEGYVSGWMDGYLLTSAPAYGGNSGGPVYYKGKVIGLLVRGSQAYPHLTLTVSLEECLRRIAETPPL